MSKKRKTKKEKIASAQRKTVVSHTHTPVASHLSYSLPAPIIKKEESSVTQELVKTHLSSPMAAAVKHDIRHTMIASSIVISINALLYLFKDPLFSILVH